MSDYDHVTKLPKLGTPGDYIMWRRRVYAYLRRDDAELLGLSEEPEAVGTPTVRAATKKAWLEKSTRAKSILVLCLGDSPLAQARTIVDDDDRTAKDLWDELKKIYTTSNAQVVLNLRNELDSLRFKETEDWNTHVNKFLEVLGKLATFDSDIPETEKASKLIRTLPESFGPLAMISTVSELDFEKLINTVSAEIARRENQKSTKGNPTPSANIAQKHDRGRGRGRRGQTGPSRGRIGKGHNNNCYVCGRPGHFAAECWHRLEGGQGGGTRGRGRGYRGRVGSRGSRGRGRGHYQRQDYYLQQDYSHQTFPSQIPSGGSQGFVPTSGAQMPPTQGTPQAQMTQYPDPFRQDYSGHAQPPDKQGRFGFMAKLKFRSSVATLDRKKRNQAYIDSGATHHFFHSRSAFISYETIKSDSVQSASGSSPIVGKGQILIPLNGNFGTLIEAYHAPKFSNNILSVGILSKSYNIDFSSENSQEDLSTCTITVKGSRKVIFTSPEREGLFVMDLTKGPSSSTPPPNPRNCPSQAHNVIGKSGSGTLGPYTDEELEGTACIVCSASLTSEENNDGDEALKWHRKLGHPSAERHLRLSNMFQDIPTFTRDTLKDMSCAPCMLAKARRAAIRRTSTWTKRPLEQIFLDISGPVAPSLDGNTYSMCVLDSHTAKSDVFLFKEKSELPRALMEYQSRAEVETGQRLGNIRLDRAGENTGHIVIEHCLNNGIKLEYSPPYASQSNGAAERLVQEHWMRTRVLLFGSKLPNHLWAEAMRHGNWLRNRLPAERVNGNIPILLWDARTSIDFVNLPVFGQAGYAFVYRSRTAPRKKLQARTVHGHFVGMESDETLYRIYVPENESIIITRKADFHLSKGEPLPGVSSLLDGIARQSALEHEHAVDGHAEDTLVQAYIAYLPSVTAICYGNRKRKNADPILPCSFREACSSPDWAAAIDREYKALVDRGTWVYVHPSAELRPVSFTWVFRRKQLDKLAQEFLYKARCCVRGDLQQPHEDFDPNNLYAPVASHEALRLILALAASQGLLLEGADIANAYLYGDLDVPVVMKQPTNSSGIEAFPGMLCRLIKSIYGIRQAGEIWGSLLCVTLLGWGFKVSGIDKRVYFLKIGSEFVIIAVVVDDMKFASNSLPMLKHLKSRLAATFDIKLFGSLKTFIGWEIDRSPQGIRVTQTQYCRDLLSCHGMDSCNAVWTPLPTNVDLLPKRDDEDVLSTKEHASYRSVIGGLLYLAVCTRPDLSFPVSALARQVHAPTTRHQLLLKRVLRYVSATTHLGLHYPATGPAHFSAFVDADWGGCRETRHSTSGFVIGINEMPVYWKSARQTVIALSSAEAEYIAISSCAKQVTWLRKLFWELCNVEPWSDSSKLEATCVKMDSTAAMSLATSEVVSGRNKHIDIKMHHVRQLIKSAVLRLEYVPTEKMPADILTKVMPYKTLETLRDLLGLTEFKTNTTMEL